MTVSFLQGNKRKQTAALVVCLFFLIGQFVLVQINCHNHAQIPIESSKESSPQVLSPDSHPTPAPEVSPIEKNTSSAKEVSKEGSSEPSTQSSHTVDKDRLVRNTPSDYPFVATGKFEPPRPLEHLNRQTDNLNLLMLGVEDNRPLMVTVYSINKETLKSSAVFFPTDACLNDKGDTLVDIYRESGYQGIKDALQDKLEIKITAFLQLNKQALIEVEKILGPVYYKEQQIEIPALFTMAVSPEDENILRVLMQECVQPRNILKVPSLIAVFLRYVTTDLTAGNLWQLYRLGCRMPFDQFGKVIVDGSYSSYRGKLVYQIMPQTWLDCIYRATE